MNRHRPRVVSATAIALGLLTASCGGESKSDDTTAPSPAATTSNSAQDVTATSVAAMTDATAVTTGPPVELASAPGFDPDSGVIRVGVLTPLTGPVAQAAGNIVAGNQVWFDRVNAQGGIGGRYKVELVVQDSQYDPQAALPAYNGMKGDVALFAQVLGTAIVKTLLPQLATDGIIAQPASQDANWVHEPNLIPIGSTYQLQMINGVSYVAEEMGKAQSVFCSLLQDDALGEADQEGVEYAAEHLGLNLATTVRFAPNNQDFTAQVQELADAGCEVVAFGGAANSAAKLIPSAVQLGFTATWIVLGNGYTSAFMGTPLQDYLAENWLISASGTEWEDRSVPGQAQMLDDLAAYAPDQVPDLLFPYGYVEGIVTTAILEKAVELGDLSRAGILEASQQVGEVDLLGLQGSFLYGAADERTAPTSGSIFSIDPAKPTGLSVLATDYTSDAATAYGAA
jgi:ABC-type branched-subunit amino acid transport system substrate-binding protein